MWLLELTYPPEDHFPLHSILLLYVLMSSIIVSYQRNFVLMISYLKTSHVAVFCAWDSSLHLPDTPAQLMKPGIGRSMSYAVGDFT